MDILKWFDIKKKEHLEAYNHLRQTGEWPKNFIPDGIEFRLNWQVLLMAKFANTLWMKG